ncbi:exonuclease domain-containing protein [Capnocytophaga sp. oral taxon 863]|uniref:exonuclease domain-containing protein n=1 Tax=Capnocytophaga sp. oral taxon 863 TaxID=1227265 RepID=UPI000427BF3E|nr:exonuclease domain-containing protein [Capnocytophaga sp. oral taxon 863]
MYAILDIETTGGKMGEEAITEIAIYRFDGREVTDRFISLINPEKKIDDFVVRLTGISNKMVRQAPKFYEVAKRIVEITEGCILVAHNAAFDYRILCLEFRRLGFDYQRRTICTVEMSQRLLPNEPSYSLGKLCRSLGIPLSDRHRANGDAMATVHLFKLLLDKDTEKIALSEFVKQNLSTLPIQLLSLLDGLPNQLGVYYLYDKAGKLLLLSKSKNIYKRVNEHFTSSGKRDLFLRNHVGKVMYELTGTLLIASLKEAEELQMQASLRKYKKKKSYPFALVCHKNKKGYHCLSVIPRAGAKEPLAIFESQEEGLNMLFEMTERYGLCTKLNGFSQAHTYCYNHSIGKCAGACMGDEAVEDYNRRVEEALAHYTLVGRTFAIMDKGRTVHEKSVIFIEQGRLRGYAFIALNYQLSRPILEKHLTPLTHNSEKVHLIEHYLRTHPLAKQIAIKD